MNDHPYYGEIRDMPGRPRLIRQRTRQAIIVTLAVALVGVLLWMDAKADTVGPITPTGASVTVTLPVAPVGPATIRMNVYDPDFADEGRLIVNGAAPIILFGTQTTGDTGTRDVAYPTTALVAGANTIAWTHRTGAPPGPYYRVNRVTVEYTAPAPPPPVDPLRAWLQAAPAGEVWAVSREDTEPAVVMVCATINGQRYAAALPAEVAALPVTAPPTTACDMAWCYASGPGRAAEIRTACP